MTLLWPRDVLAPQTVAVNMAPRSVSGPPSLSGFVQTVASPAGGWLIRLQKIPVTRARITLWRGLAALIEGRTNAVTVPAYDDYARRPFPDGIDSSGSVPFADETLFSDETGFYSGYIDILAGAAAAQGAVTVVLDKVVAGDVEPGMLFSAGERLYVIKAITSQTDTAATVKVWPPLREAIGDGATLNFDNPLCKCRLASDTGLDLPLDFGRTGIVNVDFIEDQS